MISLDLPIVNFISAVLLFIGLSLLLLTIVATRLGTAAALRRLNRWVGLPVVLLPLFESHNIQQALVRSGEILADVLNARGTLVALLGPDKSARKPQIQILTALGSLQGRSDKAMSMALAEIPALVQLMEGKAASAVLPLSSSEFRYSFKRAFTDASPTNLLVMRLKAGINSGLILLDLSAQKRIDAFSLEVLEATVKRFPAIAESVTARLMQAHILEQMLSEAQQKDQILQQVMDGFQHDIGHAFSHLRIGLNSVREAADQLYIPDGADPPDELLERLQAALDMTARVAHSGLLLMDTASGESSLKLERCDPLVLFNASVRPVLVLRAEARPGIDVRVDLPTELAYIRVDQVAFFRILSNIIHNAFKFTRTGEIRIRAHNEAWHVAFSVTDTGMGIPAGEIKRITQGHYRAGNTAAVSGSGRGLWVVGKLLEMMSGSLHIQSTEGQGSVFTVKFKRNPQDCSLSRLN